MTTEPIQPRSDRELAAARLLPAPPERVFAAFREPERLARWWGPNGFTNTFQEFEFEPGGAWRLTMHGPDGKDYPNESTFTAVDEPHRVALRHDVAPVFDLSFDLEPADGGTRLVMRQVFADADTCRKIAAYAGDGNEQTLDRLAALLAEHDA